MEQASFKVYGYRWAILLGFMAIVALNQLMWITFAPITSSAASYYGVSDLSIGLLSMIFMIVYLIVSIPASWAIDTWGFRIAVGIGAVLTGVFGLMRGLMASSFTWVFVAQIGLAVGQPFILNAVTKVAARWFPLTRASNRFRPGFAGHLHRYRPRPGVDAVPHVAHIDPEHAHGLRTRRGGGRAGVPGAGRENPPTPPCPPGQDDRSLVFDGLRDALRNRGFILLMVIFFIGLGVFNAVTTWIEDILRPRGFDITQAGVTGGLMVFGGIVGALILPGLSDRYRRRVPFIVIALLGATPGLIGITFATTYPLLLASAFCLGFFLLSTAPIGFQYGAEVTYPAPEGTTNGLLLQIGQLSGIAFIFAMDGLKSAATGSMTVPLLGLVVLMVVGLILSTRLKESQLLQAGKPVRG